MIVFEDEASFRQTRALYATWSRRGTQPQVPTRGERHTQKIFGAVRLDPAKFVHLHQSDYFQWETYLAFVDQVLILASKVFGSNLVPDCKKARGSTALP